ncbi:MAG: lantibiotic immunity ABC transporter MutG family permease subunit [Clostridioides sp.]|jgi:ABC-2 type transport system permease protein|nr:lantibiotic immunity ABC transporter MutG family permease subunit [Clostridioides sp.]
MTRIDLVLKSGFMKLRRSHISLLHILLPVLAVLAFTWYAGVTKVDKTEIAVGYFQVLSLGFPTIIGVVCAMVAERDMNAGKGFDLLTSTNPKVMSIVGMLITTLFLGFLSVIIAVMGFGESISAIYSENPFTMKFYFIVVCTMILTNTLLYAFHLFVSLRFGKGASTGLGVFGSLVSALMITGLGDGIWMFIPCSWSIRFTTMLAYAEVSPGSLTNQLVAEARLATVSCTAMTVIVIVGLLIWFNRWEGKTSYE